MTNEEARRILLDIADQMPSDECADWIDAISLGFKALDQRWIPVRERLPKKGEIVLWCNKDGRVFSSAITYLTKIGFRVGKHYGVIAWMPLPEPYKAESEE